MRRYLKAGTHPTVFSDMQWSLQSILEYSHPEPVPAPAPTRPPSAHRLPVCLSEGHHGSSPMPTGTGLAHTQVHAHACPVWMRVDAYMDVHTPGELQAGPELELGSERTQS